MNILAEPYIDPTHGDYYAAVVIHAAGREIDLTITEAQEFIAQLQNSINFLTTNAL